MRFSLFFALLLFSFSSIADLIVTEIFANPKGKDKAWIEIFNTSNESVPVAGLEIRLLIKKAKEEVLKISIENDNKLIINPNSYLVIAQSNDLNLDYNLDIPILILKDIKFSFASKTLNHICIKPLRQNENCVQFSNSKTLLPENKSLFVRSFNNADNSEPENWETEECLLDKEIYASPGSVGNFCKTNPDFYKDKIKSVNESIESKAFISDINIIDEKDNKYEISFNINDLEPSHELHIEIYALDIKNNIVKLIDSFWINEENKSIKQKVDLTTFGAFEFKFIIIAKTEQNQEILYFQSKKYNLSLIPRKYKLNIAEAASYKKHTRLIKIASDILEPGNLVFYVKDSNNKELEIIYSGVMLNKHSNAEIALPIRNSELNEIKLLAKFVGEDVEVVSNEILLQNNSTQDIESKKQMLELKNSCSTTESVSFWHFIILMILGIKFKRR
jgi:hypothetical protein